MWMGISAKFTVSMFICLLIVVFFWLRLMIALKGEFKLSYSENLIYAMFGHLSGFTFFLYHIHFEITGDPCNLIGSKYFDLPHSCSKLSHFFKKWYHSPLHIASFLIRVQREM